MRHVAVAAAATVATVAAAAAVWPSKAPKIVNLGKANNKCDTSVLSPSAAACQLSQFVSIE